ncbi:hypothetical protein [Crocosphaera chwakensis]|uniref:Uncharacterized protein n=1 Tax=Crocosphaera chwakensis CCY0110 TaxID=391612 RepID=A3IKS2_9CHRO|nr:hypothetical protein [Crocosphaera chwakensis]EAZ92791.1 hypothetical protein CY0110_21882 [Crocosphaera chwakensis CCY0110]
MHDKLTANLNQIDLDDLISESVDNAVSRRQQNLELENDIVEISDQDVKKIKGGFPHTCGMVQCDLF